MSEGHILRVDGTRLLLDNEPYFFQGLSFFNAFYNPAFNAETGKWLDVFLANGCNALRVWCQWDFDPVRRPFVDSAPESTLFRDDGGLKPDVWQRLEALLRETDERGMVVEVTLFAKEKAPDQPLPYLLNGTRAAAEALRPFRHVILQLWNEHTRADRELFDTAKKADPDRARDRRAEPDVRPAHAAHGPVRQRALLGGSTPPDCAAAGAVRQAGARR
jgi:hypothetical protein